MLRFIPYLLMLALMSYGALWLAEHPGQVLINWQGYEIRMELGILLGLSLCGAVIIVSSILLVRGILLAPKRMAERHQLRRYEHAIYALNHTMTALALNDHREAERQLQKSRQYLKGDPPVTRLLGVQLAHATGKDASARAAFDAMLEDSSTRPVALRGKIRELMQQNQWVHARDFAEEAFADRPSDHWLAMVLIDILFRERDWTALAAMMDRSLRKKALTRPQARHYNALMYLVQAQDAATAGRWPQAQQSAEMALKQQPLLLAARLLQAEALAAQKETKRLLNCLQHGWRQVPHPALADLFVDHFCDDAPAKVQKRLAQLISPQEEHPESVILQARVALALKDFAAARTALNLALSKGESARIYALLAALETAEHGNDKQAAHWLSLAVHAPKDFSWGCTHCGSVHEAWHAHCQHCQQFDALDWTRPLQGSALKTVSGLDATDAARGSAA